MENTKRPQILLLIYVLLLVGCIVFGVLNFLTQSENDDLRKLINQQNNLLKDVKKRDSIYVFNVKHYTNIIKKYDSIATNKSVFYIGEGTNKYSIAQFVKQYDKLQLELNILNDSLKYNKSRLNFYKSRANYYEKVISKFNSDMDKSDQKTKLTLDSLEKAYHKNKH